MKARNRQRRTLLRVISFVCVAVGAAGSSSFVASARAQDPADATAAAKPQPQPSPDAPPGEAISARARAQILALAADKAARTAPQRKISARLLYATKARRGLRLAGDVTTLRSSAAVRVDDNNLVDVEIRADAIKPVAEAIAKAGGTVLYGSDTSPVVRAAVPIDQLEAIAQLAEVRNIRPTALWTSHRQWQQSQAKAPMQASSDRSRGSRPDFSERAARVRERLQAALAQRVAAMASSSALEAQSASTGAAAVAAASTGAATIAQPAAVAPPRQLAAAGAATSAGDVAHRAEEARNFFGVTGAGVKIGVLSDSVDFLAQSQASGDLPADLTVLPGQSGVPGIGEGTAMLEIVHDLAPGAKLFFATATTSINSFADNIRALRAAGCDIIVDDILYAIESPFQDSVVAQAVNEVTADGAIYFSSAGNEGNTSDGTSSVWEGDFKQAAGTIGVLDGAGDLHDFGRGVLSNRVETASDFILALFWSDPFGASGNDYDFYILNNNLTAVLDASTDTQDGDDDPFEGVIPGAFAGERIVVARFDGETRALHLNNFGGELGIATSGSTHGHSTAANAFGVAAVNAATAAGGAFTGGATNPVELFSSDGWRRVFFTADGDEITPGNVLFGTRGGEVRRKPDLAAADGVQTTVPGFAPFFGTSASAPHAAAIAGLLKSARPAIRPNRVRQALQQTALDIEAAGRDRDSGFGIVDAFDALMSIDAPPAPFLELGPVTTAITSGDGDEFLEPGESATLVAALTNIGGATALNPKGTLTSPTTGVNITTSQATYPSIGSNGQSATHTPPFAFGLASSATCGVAPDFALTATYTPGTASPQTFTFRVPLGGEPADTPASTSYTGPAVAIPDASPTGVAIPFTVSGVAGGIADLTFSIDGTSCSSTAGSTSVGLDHTWVGDLVITLRSPRGTTVTLASRPGGVLNSGNNFCNTVLSDAGATSIQNVTAAQAPYTGTFRPASPLSAFEGEDPNGTWTLNLSDLVTQDTGSVRAFSLNVTPFECSTASAAPPTTAAAAGAAAPLP